MLREALALLQEAHGPHHIDELEMKRYLKTTAYDHEFIEKYLYSFLRACEKCRKEKVLRIPMRENYFVNIYERIANI